ncbi:hypothetical protein lerEdw1_009822 [Lerista edwardsae]|nr:hypothetical protein lerEdw1_009822 [Lerista edwardsae]
MTSAGFTGLSHPGTLPEWPFLGQEGSFAALMQPPGRHSGPKGLPAPQRTQPSRRVADFSIRSILALRGSEEERESRHEKPAGDAVEQTGAPRGNAWICCPRVRPPSVPKLKQVGAPHPTSRSPRVPFSATQLGTLENSFRQTRYLSTGQVRDVALLLGLTENRVKIWFQNRRAREKRDFLKQHPNSSVGPNRTPLQDPSPLGWH